MSLQDNVVYISPKLQEQMRVKARLDCYQRMLNETAPIEGVHCPRRWDSIACWPPTAAGVQAEQPCPDYINKFIVDENATKICKADGEWFISSETNHTWTNYSQCISTANPEVPSQLLVDHVPNLLILANVGYALSIVMLLVAVILMLYFKKLHCPRNTVHINLFVTFILRAVLSFLKENLMVQGVGLPQDVHTDKHGMLAFNHQGTHWECKLLMTVYMYILGANCTWIFVEGLYLHMLIFMAVFSENSSVAQYIAIGWFSPLLFVIPWVVVRATLDDFMCWNVYTNKNYFWIIRGPLTFLMVVNFLFFLNIVRVVFTKMSTGTAMEARGQRYRKMAKSTLVLIPLFGIHYMVFIWIDPSRASDVVELVWLYFEMFFNSFQGVFIALLFCFFNGEVRAEVKKSWQRYQLRRGGASFNLHSRDRSFMNTSTTYVSPPDKTDYQNATEMDTLTVNGHRGP
ncbi:hypothetical protein CAPTEDRAFT_220667 [Capitella teleta]|uniref:G-protein coupled receptors family 2 profile 2 domain-containing protein n=1 Tax=Capitella teleta TaxID=283909 RepID=R7UVQ3_CAPTE|nr:hypothetical protein CAPTEDRAFT_220667 [Capitella teleta]|eukprot:ELU10673.1 hypothetical protein CAPTEDRAFT_220667 [Capitella teleta]